MIIIRSWKRKISKGYQINAILYKLSSESNRKKPLKMHRMRNAYNASYPRPQQWPQLYSRALGILCKSHTWMHRDAPSYKMSEINSPVHPLFRNTDPPNHPQAFTTDKNPLKELWIPRGTTCKEKKINFVLKIIWVY